MRADWRDSQIRYLVHFSDGGSGMRYRDEPLTVGVELTDGARRYRVERVEPPPNPNAFGHACVIRATHVHLPGRIRGATPASQRQRLPSLLCVVQRRR